MDTAHPQNIEANAQICLRILELWRHMKSTIEEFASEHNLTLQQIFVLYNLCGEDHILMGTLAKHLHCDASNVTGMVDRLQSLGLIERRALPEDRRAKQLSITSKGRELIESLIPRLPAGLGFQELKENETTTLYGLLNKLCV
jgi:DNA-binding MarR family transcriptional regulator